MLAFDFMKQIESGKNFDLWAFDQTDMAKAKEIIGDVACIAGNVPSSLLTVGTPNQVKNYVQKLIEICGEGGGFMVMNGAVIEKAKPENVKAMIEATKEYGKYK